MWPVWLGEEPSDPPAQRAVDSERQNGWLLPCNSVVCTLPDHEGTVIVEAMNPRLLFEVTGEPTLGEVADGWRVRRA